MTVHFFKPYGWLGRAFRLTERRRASVNEAVRIAECRRLLTEPWTDADREAAERATRAYLASVEQGC